MFGLAILAFAPGLFWLWFFARRDIYRPTPRRLLILSFVLGMAATIPAGILNTVFIDDSVLSPRAGIASVASAMLIVVGPVEETCKFAGVWFGARRSAYFEEPLDAMVHAAAVSLGFASLENLVYVINFGPEVMIGRAPLSTVAHVLFGSFWGYALASGLRSGRFSRVRLGIGVGAAAIAHGLFNLALFTHPWVALAAVPLGFLLLMRRFEWARLASPFRLRRNVPFRDCPSCERLIRTGSKYCPACGDEVVESPSITVCGYCGADNRPEARFCKSCGDALVRPTRS